MRLALHVFISHKINSKTSKSLIKYWNPLLKGDIIFSSSDICVDTDATNITLSRVLNLSDDRMTYFQSITAIKFQ
jgi:hypothetical protein